jgi:hypothetical protein
MRAKKEVKLQVESIKQYIVKIEKLSKRGYSFNNRTLYVDN